MHDSERRRTDQRKLLGRVRVVDVVVLLLVLAVAWLIIPVPASDGDEPSRSTTIVHVDHDPTL